MTRKQIAESLNVHVNYINIAFEKAIKEHPELDLFDYSLHNQKDCGIDYTLEQVMLGLSYLRNGKGLSELEKIIIEEDFTMRPQKTAKAIGIDGTEEFIRKVNNFPKKKCCATCAYCTKSTVRNQKPTLYPFCLYHERYLHLLKSDKGKIDVYNDYCYAWKYSEKEPLIFYKADSPTNLDIYGNVKNEVMGFDVSAFGKDSKEVKLVTDVGMDALPDFED